MSEFGMVFIHDLPLHVINNDLLLMSHKLSKIIKGVCSRKINAAGDPDYDCACPTGYSGRNCEFDECQPQHGADPCLNDG